MADERRLNIRVSEDTHYWLGIDAARYGRSLQEHVNTLLSERARSISEQFGNIRPEADEGRKAGSYAPLNLRTASPLCDRPPDP